MFNFVKKVLCRELGLTVQHKKKNGSLEELKRLTEELNSRSEILREEQKRISLDFSLGQFSLELSDVSVFSSVREIAELVLESAKKLTESRSGFIIILVDKKMLNGNEKQVVTTDPKILSCSLREVLCPYELFRTESKDVILLNNMTDKKCSLECGITNFLSVPVLVDNKVVSRIVVSNKENGYFEKDIQIIERIAEIFSCTLIKFKELQKSVLQKSITGLVRNFVDNFNFPVFWTETSGKVVYMNKSFLERLRFSSEKVEDLTIFDLFPTISPKKWSAFLEKIETVKNSSINTILNKRPVKISSFISEEGEKKVVMSVVLPRKTSEKRA